MVVWRADWRTLIRPTGCRQFDEQSRRSAPRWRPKCSRGFARRHARPAPAADSAADWSKGYRALRRRPRRKPRPSRAWKTRVYSRRAGSIISPRPRQSSAACGVVRHDWAAPAAPCSKLTSPQPSPIDVLMPTSQALYSRFRSSSSTTRPASGLSETRSATPNCGISDLIRSVSGSPGSRDADRAGHGAVSPRRISRILHRQLDALSQSNRLALSTTKELSGSARSRNTRASLAHVRPRQMARAFRCVERMEDGCGRCHAQ